MQGRDPSSRQADRTLPASSGAPESGVHHAGSHQTDHQHAAHHNGDRGSSAHQTILSIVAADDAAEQPQLLEECRSGERSSAAVLGHQGAGDIHGKDSVNPAVLLFAAKKSKSKMDILHNFSPFFTPQDWFDAPCFTICNKTAKSVAQCAKKTEKDLCGIFLTIVIY